MRTTVTPSADAVGEQAEYAARVRSMTGGGTYHIVTYGCQMNAHDSEKLAGQLASMGYAETQKPENADIVVYNTCCVRDNAERRVFGNVARARLWKEKRPGQILAVCGCMMQQQGMAEKLKQRNSHVDLVFGTHNLHRFPQLLCQALGSPRGGLVSIETEESLAEGVPVLRREGVQAFVTIMYGCNNFCSYCIVPYVRGRERSRSMDEILREAEALAQSGVREIMLLGQNVNSYGERGFPRLLRRLDGIVPRIRFMTSHPKDLSDELIGTMAGAKSVCRQLHLPVQSGSDAILGQMNRGYDRAEYLGIVRKLREAMPDIGLTTDVIVGFPGETEGDFQNTLDLVAEARYDSAFTFNYSPRNGTRAALLPGRIPSGVMRERIGRLIALQEGITAEALRSEIGKIREVLVEGMSAKGEGMACGRTERGWTVNFPGPASWRGELLPVRITECGHNTLRGAPPGPETP